MQKRNHPTETHYHWLLPSPDIFVCKDGRRHSCKSAEAKGNGFRPQACRSETLVCKGIFLWLEQWRGRPAEGEAHRVCLQLPARAARGTSALHPPWVPLAAACSSLHPRLANSYKHSRQWHRYVPLLSSHCTLGGLLQWDRKRRGPLSGVAQSHFLSR